jgi:hypothetical protein
VDKQLAKEFRERWQAVAAVEIEEQKTASIALKLKQLNAILRLAIGLGLPLEKSEEEIAIVRQRWMKLKEAYSSLSSPQDAQVEEQQNGHQKAGEEADDQRLDPEEDETYHPEEEPDEHSGQDQLDQPCGETAHPSFLLCASGCR